MEKSNFFQIDRSVILLLFLVVVLIISIFLLINYQKTLVLSYRADMTLAAIPAHKVNVASKQKISATPTIDPYADWKVYEDEDNGFTFKYPSDLYVTADPYRDGSTLIIISDDNRETLSQAGWSGIFVTILSNPSRYDSKTFIQWNVKNDPLNASVTIKKIPILGLDVSQTQGEVVGGNGDSPSRVYIAKGDRVFLFSPNHQNYLDILNKILPTFNYL